MDIAAADTIRHERPEQLSPHPQSTRVPALTRDEYTMLRADIARRGVVTPLELTSELVVLDGHERLRAARELALASVPVRVVAPPDEVAYMLLAALRRRQLSASQRAALALELEEIEQAKADAEARRLANLRPEVATLPPRGEKTRELAARLAGVSPRTVQDAATVRSADPELFQQIKDGHIHADKAARRVRQRQKRLQLVQDPVMPQGPFQLIYADPPWQLGGDPESAFAPENHYPTLALEQITAIDVPAAEDALLLLWVPCGLLRQGLAVMEAWGFHYVAQLVWVKPSIGLGNWVRYRHEPLLVGRRGRFPAPDRELRPDSVIEAPRGRHSKKPEAVYQLIERLYPEAAKLELFARKARAGWAAYGNEVPA